MSIIRIISSIDINNGVQLYLRFSLGIRPRCGLGKWVRKKSSGEWDCGKSKQEQQEQQEHRPCRRGGSESLAAFHSLGSVYRIGVCVNGRECDAKMMERLSLPTELLR